MGIRSKFLIILIIFSVVPLLGFYLINQKLFNKLGDDIFQIATILLLQTTAKELQDSADNHARNLNRELTNIAQHIESYRDDLERGMGLSGALYRENDQWLQQQVVLHMPDYFRKMQGFRNDLVSLSYFSESGLIYTYPTKQNNGAGSNPFEGREMSASGKPGEVLWTLPGAHRPGSPGLPYISAGLPVRSNSGSLLGLVTVDVDIMALLETTRPSSQWSQYKTSLFIEVDPSRQSRSAFPLIIGIKRPLSGQNEWKAEMFPLVIDPSFNEEMTALFGGMRYGETGYVSLPYEGENSIWAYSGTELGAGILNILSEREPLYRIARHPERLSKWLNLDSLLIVSVVVVIMVIIVAYRSRRMLEPFFSMITAFRGVAAGDFSTRLEFNARDERQMVADAFNNMAVQLEDGMRMRHGLEVAQEVQQNFFPEVDFPLSGLDIGVRMSYCEETGGDYIDVLQGNDGEVCIVVGDVTGHGIGAALLVATVRALIRGRYEVDNDLATAITAVNSRLTIDMGDSGRFVTLFILEIDPVSRELRWVRAGHDPAWLFCLADGSIVTLDGPGIALGVDAVFDYSESVGDRLAPGDVLLIGTDGIWETSDPEGNQFGKERVEQIVSENIHLTALGICDSLMTGVNDFRGDQKQEDDVSIVVIKTAEL